MKKNGGPKVAVTERTVVNQNGTLYVSIPKAFATLHSIQAGDRLPMIMGKGQLKIIPHEK
jgi:hypothetical protein